MFAVAAQRHCPLRAGNLSYCPHHVGTITGAGRFNRMPTPPVHTAGGVSARVATEILRAGMGLADVGPVLRHDSHLTTQLFGNDWRSKADVRPPKALGKSHLDRPRSR